MQENNNNEKIYISSKGEKLKIKDMETTHLTNALAKAYRDSFSSTSKQDFAKYVSKINDLKEEIHKRINSYYEGLNE